VAASCEATANVATITGPSGVDLTPIGPIASARFALSPDGQTLAFVGGGTDSVNRLWVRGLNSTDYTLLVGTENANVPFWSPDSQSIGFVARQQLKRVDLSGGPPSTVCGESGPLSTATATWHTDDFIYFGAVGNGPIRRRDARSHRAAVDTAGGSGAMGAFSVSKTSVLAYQTAAGGMRSQLVWFDHAGNGAGPPRVQLVS
jgi:hypothetical protein